MKSKNTKKYIKILLFFSLLCSSIFFTFPENSQAATINKPPYLLFLNSGLIGHWTMDGTDTVWTSSTAATTVDKSGNSNTGTLTSMAQATSPVAGKIGQGLNFDGVNDYVNIGNVGEIKTLSYWINTNSNKFNAIPYAGDTFYKDGINTGSLLGSEKVTNGTFPSNVSSWIVNGVSTLGWVNDTSGDGSTGYARFTIASNSSYNRFSQDVTTSANTTYLLSFWYRTSGITGNMLVFFTSDENTLDNAVSSSRIIPSTSWRYFSVIVNTNTLSVPDMSISKFGSVGSGTFDIDAISLKPLTNSIGTGWHHIVTTSSNAIYASLMTIGEYSTGQVTGLLDDVRIYNRVLTATEITQLYNFGAAKQNLTITPTALTSGLVGHWTFDGKNVPWTSATAATALDSSGNSNTGTLTSMAQATSPVAGKIGQGLTFDGTNDYVRTASTMNFGGTKIVTVSFWLNQPIFTNTDLFVMELSNNTNDFSSDGTFHINPNAVNGRFSVAIQDGSAGVLYKMESFTRPSAGVWHHYSIVIDNSTTAGDVTAYVDGVLQSTTIDLQTKNQNSDIKTDTLYFMSRAGTSLINSGKLDDVRIHNRALTASEITQLYNFGAVKQNLTITPTGLQSGLVGHWTFDGKNMPWTSVTAATALDSSGNSNTGTLTNMAQATSPVAGKIGQGLKFDGVDDYVGTTNSSSLQLASTLSASVWVKPISSGGIVAKYVQTGIKSGWSLQYGFAVADTFSLAFRQGDTISWAYRINVTSPPNIWYHVAFAYPGDGSEPIVWLNGVQQTLVAIAGGYNENPASALDGFTDSGTNLLIGYTNVFGISDYFNGSLDDVRVYNRALSATEVTQLYNLGR